MEHLPVYVLLLFGVLVLPLPVTCIPKCPTKKSSFTNIPTFMVNNVEQPMDIHRIIMEPLKNEHSNVTECFIEIEELLAMEHNFTGPRIRAYAFACRNTTTVVINGTSTPFPEIVSYVQIQGCDMGVDSLNVIANVTSLTVLNIVSKSTLTKSPDREDCAALDGIGTLMIANQRFPSLDMEVFYSCKNHLSFMAEITLYNLSLSHLPPRLYEYMPTLQGLDLSVNNFTVPPVFPWDNTTRNLPRNLTRTTFFQNQYTYGTVTMPAYQYRREFRLDANPNLNLTAYTFRGFLHILSIARCELKSLPIDIFYEVEGLQLLNLAHNKLETIPFGLFAKSSSLHKLELQGNLLRELEAGVFSGLKDLTRLDLSSNQLTTLNDHVFADMFQLEKVNLKNNKLTYINKDAFSILLTKLKLVNLENNPLVHVPEGLFLLRGLYDIRLSGHNITDLNFTRIDEDLQFDQLKYIVADSISSPNPNIDIPSDGLRKVDMSNGPMQKISFTPFDQRSPIKLALLLKHYKFVLDDNPINCDCHILNFTRYVKEIKRNGTLGSDVIQLTLYGTEYAFNNWKCSKPNELSKRNLLQLRDEETYCPHYSPDCPLNCACYKRSVVGTNIVDCRNRSLTEAPKSLPEGDTELWLQDNMITNFRIGSKLSGRLVELNLERNGLETLGSDCLTKMPKLRKLYIQNNLLASIPGQIQSMNLESIKLGGNPFQCDCHSLWMKHWLSRNFDTVEDYDDIKCVNNVEDTGTNILKVNDEDFICEEVPIYKIAVPTAVPTGLVLIILISLLVLYIHWDNFKVFLYVHTGAHPFDKKDPDGVMRYDAFVVYPTYLVDWVHEHVVNPLQDNDRYTIYDVSKDFKFGHSLQENVQHGVQYSRRMILLLSEGAQSDSLMQIALESGIEKSREEKANFMVPVLYDSTPKNFENEQLQKYFKAKKYVNNSTDHFLKRLQYYMPTVPICEQISSKSTLTETVNEAFDDPTVGETKINIDDIDCKMNGNALSNKPVTLPQPDVVEGITEGSTVFVWYADSDFPFMMDRIVHPFEAEGHNFILSDKSFLPGAAIQENILHAVEDSDRTIIILSQDSLIDEWTLYVFRYASERQMVDKTFLAGIIVREGMMNVQCDEVIVKHLLTYQPLSEKDTAFHKKMHTFIELSRKGGRHNDSRETLAIDVKL